LVGVDYVTPEFVQTMGMHIKNGRDFYQTGQADSSSIIINEAFAKAIHAKNIIGTLITNGSDKFTVVGVINDFVYNNMYRAAEPLIIFCSPNNGNVLTMRIKEGGDLKAALAGIENVIKKNNPGYPVEYKFVDAEFEQYFKAETLIGKLAGVFSVLAIVISCLGLFGLAAYTAEKRTKEIGIRKVLGASSKGLAALLSKEFILLVVISCLIAFPFSWWMMSRWLQDYEYRVEISWWIFAGAGLLSVAIAIATVSVQAIRAALMNPVKSLRAE